MTQDSSSSVPRGATVYLSIGSNLGDRLSFLRGALRFLERQGSIAIEAVSSVYETDPAGLVDQPVFLNIAVRVKTTLSPRELLSVCQNAENYFERDHTTRWGPRTLDIDLLTYEGVTLNEPDLVLPHPRMEERDFVRIPMQELLTGRIGCAEGVRPLYANWYPKLAQDDLE